MVRILCVMDNVVSGNKGLKAQHGLSFYLEAGGKKLLFDFGQGRDTWENGRRLGVPFSSLDYAVFSHSHYDHCAGFLWAEEYGMKGCAVLGNEEAFFQKKYALSEIAWSGAERKGGYGDQEGKRQSGERKGREEKESQGEKEPAWVIDLGCGFTKEYLWEKTGQQWISEDVLPLGEGLWAVGGFARTHPWERIPKRFVKEVQRGVMVSDDFKEEICLAAETGNGLAVIVGCSHPGLLNMLDTVEQKLKRPIRAVIGGAHLADADKERLLQTAEGLTRLGVSLAAFNHCTGTEFVQLLGKSGIRSGYFGAGSCLYL